MASDLTLNGIRRKVVDMSTYALKAVDAPKYASDGSQGYALTFDRSYVSGRTGDTVTHGPIHGWVRKGDNSEVWATIDTDPWVTVGQLVGPLTESWVWEHAEDLV